MLRALDRSRVIKVVLSITIPDWLASPFVWLVLRYRKLRYGYPFRRIPLTRGKFAIVDPEDYEALAKYKWYVIKCGRGFYAARTANGNKGRVGPKTIRMHRVIMNFPKGKVIDHINHNSLDNRKANLRAATNQQNAWNNRKQKGKYASIYKGVTWAKNEKKWRARITLNRRMRFIGYFDDEKAAAKAYDKKAKELFGEYASLNLQSSFR